MTNNRTSVIAAMTTASLIVLATEPAISQQPLDPQKAPQAQVDRNKTPPDASTEADVSRISAEGSDAFLKVVRARRAIFDARVDDAMKDVLSAAIAFGKLKADPVAFTKAEADFKPPAAEAAKVVAGQTVKAAAAAKPLVDQTSTNPLRTPVAWLPVDGDIVISEEFAETTAKKAALAEANTYVRAGDRSGALAQLKLAGMIVNVTLGVVPLDQTITDLQKAAVLIHDGKYYQASQLLTRIQDSERFDSRVVSGLPVGN